MPSDEWDDQITLAAMGLSLPLQSPPPGLRARLLRGVSGSEAAGHGAVRSGEGKWRDSGVPGITVKPLYFDRGTGLLTLLMRMAPGARYPGHRHDHVEQCLIVEGDLRHGEHVYTAGDFTWAETGSVDPALHSRDGNLLLLIADPDTKFLA